MVRTMIYPLSFERPIFCLSESHLLTWLSEGEPSWLTFLCNGRACISSVVCSEP